MEAAAAAAAELATCDEIRAHLESDEIAAPPQSALITMGDLSFLTPYRKPWGRPWGKTMAVALFAVAYPSTQPGAEISISAGGS